MMARVNSSGLELDQVTTCGTWCVVRTSVIKYMLYSVTSAMFG